MPKNDTNYKSQKLETSSNRQKWNGLMKKVLGNRKNGYHVYTKE